MILLDPVWLVLAIPLLASFWVRPLPTWLLRCLRLAVLTLLLLALTGLAVHLPSRAGTVVVVADRSESMPANAEVEQKRVIEEIQKQMGPEDRLGVVSFGRDAVVERPPMAGKFDGFLHEVRREASNLAGALETALGLIPHDAPGRVLVLSDGRWTGRDPAAVAPWAAAREVAIDYRHPQQPRTNDLAVHRIEAPSSIGPGESFLISAWVQAPTGQDVSYTLLRGTTPIASGTQRMTAGLNRLTFRDRALEPGSQGYTLEVKGEPGRVSAGRDDDPVPGNNTARVLVGIEGSRPLLHITQSANSQLARLLRAGGLKLKVKTPGQCNWGLEELSQYCGVLLENVPAGKVGTAGVETRGGSVRAAGPGGV